jgi:UDPglucose 6-dehydrogenase
MDAVVVGGGYVGAVTAACLADRGHVITVLETDPSRVEGINTGSLPFFEPGLAELLRSATASGRLRATADEADALASAGAVLVCVGTPLSATGEAELDQVQTACRAIARYAPDSTVVMRSTLPLGTSALLGGWLGREELAGVATNPEFLRQGSAIDDFSQPSRVVVGTSTGGETVGSSVVRELYRTVQSPFIVTSYSSAEMIKNAANSYLALKLSFVNEIADLCEAYEADVEAVLLGMGLDPRIGPSYLRPGIGFGGSCLPKELANVLALGRRRGLPMRTFDAASRSNDERARRTADRLESIIGSLRERRVGMLGLAFKANTDDTRYSPAIALARELMTRAARVIAHDPQVAVDATLSLPELARAADAGAAVEDADLVILATEWPEYSALDWGSLAARVRHRTLFDGRNSLNQQVLEDAGWRVIRVGQTT